MISLFVCLITSFFFFFFALASVWLMRKVKENDCLVGFNYSA